MRKNFEQQMTFGQTPIDKLKFDLKCRDEIPKVLLGLQFVYCNKELRQKVFETLETVIPENVNPKMGRPGMDLWKILVMGTVRLSCNWDYDKLHDIVNNHKKIRQMLGHDGAMDDETTYQLQTLKDNVRLLTHEILDEINKLVVEAGHSLLAKKDQTLKGRCDSFVVETDVHYPTDINLLFDAVRKIIQLIAVVSQDLGLTGWRQFQYNIKVFKKLYRQLQKLKHSTSKDKDKKAERSQLIENAHQKYVEAAEQHIVNVKSTINDISSDSPRIAGMIMSLEEYIAHAERQIDQIQRRVLKGEKIPHAEKVFSIFEPHTEWISKGKAGVPQELGLRVCVLQDQYGLVLHHRVMEKETDDKVAVCMVACAQKKFPNLRTCSFDKGFYSPANKKELNAILDFLVLPKKGKRNKLEQEEETSEEFIKAKQKHSAVESDINGLENHGLDRCPDHGIIGFKRYVGLAVLARNLQIIGNHIQQKEFKRFHRTQMDKAAA